MYTVVKSKRFHIQHQHQSQVVASCFIDDVHALFICANGKYMLTNINIKQNYGVVLTQNIFQTGNKNNFPILECKRIKNGQCVIITKLSREIILLKLIRNGTSATFIQKHKLENSMIYSMLFENHQNSNLIQTLSITSQILVFNNYTDGNGDFTIKNQIFEDRTLYFTIFNRIDHQQVKYKCTKYQHNLPLQGIFVLDICDRFNNEIAIYKQTQASNVEWEIKLISFMDEQFQNQSKEIPYKPRNVILSNDFNEQFKIVQFIRWNQKNSYLIFVFQQNNENLSVYHCKLVYTEGMLGKQAFSTWIQKAHKFEYKNPKFQKVISINNELNLLYVLSYSHQRINGQLYQNVIQLLDNKTGRIVERGCCNLKNISISPNGKYILDVPYFFEKRDELFYHIRLLLQKKNLYLFMIQNSELFKNYHNVNFIESMLTLL